MEGWKVRGNEKVKNSNYGDLKSISEKQNIPLYYVDENKKLGEYEDIIKVIKPDIILVLGWYYIVPKRIREIPKYGACGIHASLLPKYAGWAPLVWAMINGEKETGVTFFQFDDSVDICTKGSVMEKSRCYLYFAVYGVNQCFSCYVRQLAAKQTVMSNQF